MSGKNIRYRQKKHLQNISQESNLYKEDDFDCVNIEGPVDNSSCEDTDSLCKCPCTGGTYAQAAPLFREPTDEEISWAETVSSECKLIETNLGDTYVGCIASDSDDLLNCVCPCQGKDFYSYLKASRTYSTFWNTNEKVPILRNALLNLYTAQQAICIIPGNLEIKIGDFIVFPEDGSKLSDKYGGGWLIARITHSMASLQNYKMILVLIRDNKLVDDIEP